MKPLLLSSLVLFLSLSTYSQDEQTEEKAGKGIYTFEQMKDVKKGSLQTIRVREYLASNGKTYRDGDTITIGKPSGAGMRFMYVLKGGGLDLEVPTPAPASVAGSRMVIKQMWIGGSTKTGFYTSLVMRGDITGNANIQLENALASGEVVSGVMSREQAIAKLKEAKDLVDLGMMTQSSFDSLKTKLAPIIMKQ